MTSRGRGRPAARAVAEPPAAPGGRRSARGQPPQQAHEQDSIESQIDPAITGDTTGSMAPPPLPTAKKGWSQSEAHGTGRAKEIPRRGARPSQSQADSVQSVSSGPTSSQDLLSQELQGTLQNNVPWGAPSASHQRDISRDPSSSQPSSSQPSVARQRIRVNQMKKRVKGLYDAATAYFQHLSSPIPDTPEDREVWEGERKAFLETFTPLRNIYTSQHEAGQTMINVREVHGQLNEPQDDPAWLATTRAIALANIATLWETMVDRPPRDLKFLYLLESTFPDFYIPLGPQGYAMDNESILHQINEIRTQHLILRLAMLQTESRDPFNPFEEILKIFCQTHVGIDDLVEAMENNVDRLDFKGVHGIDEEWSWSAVTSMKTRISALCKELPNEQVRDVSAQLQSLEDGFSFDGFLIGLKTFIHDCFVHVSGLFTQDFAHSDTSSQIQSQIQAQIQSQIQSQLDANLARASAAVGVPRTGDLSGMLALNALQQSSARLASQDILERADRDRLNPSATNTSYPAFEGYGDPPAQANGSIYATSAAQASRKRSFEDAENEEGNPAKQSRSRRKHVSRRRPVDAVPLGRTMRTAAELGFPHAPASLDEPDFEAVSKRSREISAASRKQKKPQERNSWVREDVKALVRAVDTYKCKWSLIEREIEAGTIPFTLKRNQQALRDKARLLKQDFLKADGLLPPSFDLVVLGKKERNAVIAVGKNPDRKEADVIDGRPVNTEYRGEGSVHAEQPLESASPDAAPAPSGGAPEANMDVSLEAGEQD